ncbi:MAG TPA: hypothetical protein VFX35_01505 [Solirubrobacterales bacterium]|nr:hypothetical protein [Solirubrobacterales bacterium]
MNEKTSSVGRRVKVESVERKYVPGGAEYRLTPADGGKGVVLQPDTVLEVVESPSAEPDCPDQERNPVQIKIRNYKSSGSTNVQVIDPATGDVAHNLGVDGDQEVTLIALTATKTSDIEVGEVAAAEECQ